VFVCCSLIQSVLLRLEGLRCGGCVSNCEKALRSVQGVEAASVSLLTRTAFIHVSAGQLAPTSAAIDKLKILGYPAVVNHP
jgi:P-type Cu2+ transporter